MYTAYGSYTAYEFREPHRSLHRVYEIAVPFRLLAMTWCSAVTGCTLVHLMYNAPRDLPVCIPFIYTVYGSCTASKFMEPYRSVQRVYEIAIHRRYLATT